MINTNEYITMLKDDIEQFRQEYDDVYLRGINADEIIRSFECLVLMNPRSIDMGLDIIMNEDILLSLYTGDSYYEYISQASSPVIQDVAAAVGIAAIKKTNPKNFI